MKEKFSENLQSLQKNFRQKTFLLAVSGGADSMVLAHLFHSEFLHFHVAHVNYHFRGEDSDLDQKTVQDFCEFRNIKFHLYDVSEEEKSQMTSLETWARNLRYGFFRKVLSEENLDLLAIAHNLDDNLETFLINLSRAAGLRGLCGIPANENGIIRPLLIFPKNEITEFAENNGIIYRNDKTNFQNDFIRNKIRNNIVPQLLNVNKKFLERFAASVKYLNQSKKYIDEHIDLIYNDLNKTSDKNPVLDKHKLNEQTDFVKFEILRRFGFEKELEIAKIFNAEKGKIFISKTHCLLVDRDFFIIKEKTNP